MLRALIVPLLLLSCACPDALAQWEADPATSEFPSRIVIVCLGVSGPDTLHGKFETVIRNHWGEPLANVTVICDFDEPMTFTLASSQREAGVFTNCDHHSVYRVTDGEGRASFTILGGGLGTGPPLPDPTVSFSVDGLDMRRSATVAILDLDGKDGVSTGDLSIWVSDFFGDQHPSRSDYSGDGRVTAIDLSIWAALFFSGLDNQSATPYCP